MSEDRDDSDYEVCLTSSQLNRILSIQKQCKKERDQFQITKKQFLQNIESLKQTITSLQKNITHKNNQIDNLSIQCLRLKKLRLIQEEQIRNLKEDNTRSKQLHLSQFEFSVRENNEIKEKIAAYQSNIKDLEAQILRFKNENIALSSQSIARNKEYQAKIECLDGDIMNISKELTDSQKRASYFEKKSQDQQAQIKKIKSQTLTLSQQIQRLAMINEESTIKYKQELQQHSNIKSSLEMQLKIAKQQEQGLIKEKELKVAKLTEQSIKMNELLIEANKKIEEFVMRGRRNEDQQYQKKKENQNQKQKFSSKIYQAIEWAKEGVLAQQELKQQISNILTFQKEYQDIISKNNSKIKELQEYILELKKINSDLVLKGDIAPNKIQKNDLLSENMIMKQEIAKLKQKVNNLNHTLESTVRTYNETINDMQSKFEKEIHSYKELHNEIEAIKMAEEFQRIENEEGVELFAKELEAMKTKSSFLNPTQVVKTLKKFFPKLNKI